MTAQRVLTRPPAGSGRTTAILGPTNTGKTHFAIERMLAHRSGMIGLPLRLLAREVYDKVVRLKGADAAALITGEEKIVPPGRALFRLHRGSHAAGSRGGMSCYRRDPALPPIPSAATSSPTGCSTSRGEEETILLGAETMRGAIQRFVSADTFHHAAALFRSGLYRREEADAAAAALGHRRVLGR